MTPGPGPPTRPDAGLAVLVVNYGSHDLLARNLVEVHAAVPEAQVVVVDNPTTPVERARVEELASRHAWTLVTPGQNLGFGGGMNAAVAALAPEVTDLLLLNPDATIDRDSVDHLVTHVRQHPEDLAAPVIRTPTGALWSAGVDLVLDRGQMRSWGRRTGFPDPRSARPWLSGACLVLSRHLWDLVGGFDEDYFLYWEDVDLSWRVQEVGGRTTLVPAASAVHDEGATHRRADEDRAKSPTYYYYNVRNRMLFAHKHLPAPDRARWRRTTIGATYGVLLQGGRRQFVHPGRSFVPAVRGAWDGLRAVHGPRPGGSGS